MFPYSKDLEYQNLVLRFNSLNELGKFDAALSVLHQAIHLKKDDPNLYFWAAKVLRRKGDLWGALKYVDEALLLDGKNDSFLTLRGDLLQLNGCLYEAVDAYNSALDERNNNPVALSNLGRVLLSLSENQAAKDAYLRAIQIDKDDATSLNSLGIIEKHSGNPDKAIWYFKKAIQSNENYVSCYRNLSQISGPHLNDELENKIQIQFKRIDLSDSDRSELCYAMFNILDHQKNFSSAFDWLKQGAALRKAVLGYSIEQDKNLFFMLEAIFSDFVCSRDERVEGDVSPIFIVGMPRSGTSLLEQIISSSDEVCGLGELGFVSDFMNKFLRAGIKASRSMSKNLRQYYTERVLRILDGRRTFTDKMPSNFRFIPAILAAFPNAKVVHIYRNPSATCWSNFSSYFVGGGVGYSYCIEDCIQYYSMYKVMMQKWSKMFGDKIIHVNYDRLVEDKNKNVNEIFASLELKINERAYTPELNTRSVSTNSSLQVRLPIFGGSSERWRRYEEFLPTNFGRIGGFGLYE